MARVISIHEVELRPGVREEAFETYFREEVAPLPNYPGWKTSLVKADSGARQGKYALLIEISSVADRDRFYPRANEATAEAQRFDQQHFSDPETGWARWATFATTSPGIDTMFSDYVVVSEGTVTD